MSDGRSAEQIGHDTGERFRLAVVSQLEAIASRAGVSVASLSVGDYGSGPAQRAVWLELDDYLKGRFVNDLGHELRIKAACIDTGGHHAAEVLQFCKLRRTRRIFPIKGVAGSRPIWNLRPTHTKKHDRLFLVGVDTAKETIHGRLSIPKPGPGYIHFPLHEDINAQYFEQLASEVIQTRYREGRPYRVWYLPSGKQNEVLDTMAYALAAYRALPLRRDDQQLAPDRPESMPPSMSVRDQYPCGEYRGMAIGIGTGGTAF
jgi:phage terminase large subunit GpA-like protein